MNLVFDFDIPLAILNKLFQFHFYPYEKLAQISQQDHFYFSKHRFEPLC